jgi:hypothetical protein
MSFGSNNGSPLNIPNNYQQMPAGVNNPTPAPGSTYLGTQQNNLFNNLYPNANTSNPHMMPTMNNFGGNPMNPLPMPQQPMPQTGIAQNINQQPGQQAAQSLGGLISGTAPASPNAPVFNVGAPPISAPIQIPNSIFAQPNMYNTSMMTQNQ